jgi:hypothetical protein
LVGVRPGTSASLSGSERLPLHKDEGRPAMGAS